MRLNPPCLTRRKFAIDGEEQVLIGQMRFFRQHSFTVRRHVQSAPKILGPTTWMFLLAPFCSTFFHAKTQYHQTARTLDDLRLWVG